MNIDIKKMVDRFLGWKLPEDFAPDCGISFKRESDYEHPVYGRTKFEPIGTNLFSADQARAMFEYVLHDAISAAPAATAQPDSEREELEAELAWHKEALKRHVAKLEAVWEEVNRLRALTAPQDAQERDAIIEECAALADKEYDAARARFNLGQEWSAWTIASAIRALKSAQPADKPQRKWTGVGELERTGYIPAGSAAEREAENKPEGKAEHPCANRCQFAQDVAMPEYSCGGECQYDKCNKAEQQQPEPDYCPNCRGTGETTVMSDNGPDAYEVPVVCPFCEGHQTLEAAFRGACKLLDAEQKKYLKACGEIWRMSPSRPPAQPQGLSEQEIAGLAVLHGNLRTEQHGKKLVEFAADKLMDFANALLSHQSGEDKRDAERWREALRHIGGTHTDTGAQRFTLRYLSPVEGANIMQGSVAGHFTDAIDAALAAQGKDGE